MQKKREFKQNNITTLRFSAAALDPLRALYEDLIDPLRTPAVEMGLKLHESGPRFKGVRMCWYFANSREAITLFRKVFDSCRIGRSRRYVGSGDSTVRVVQANLIEIRGGYPVGTWHSDFMDRGLPAGNSATILTPLYPLKRGVGGLEITAVRRESDCVDYDAHASVYRYKEGEAVVFDAFAKIHRTQSYTAPDSVRRVLVSWQIADVTRAQVPVLKRIGKRNGDPMFLFPH